MVKIQSIQAMFSQKVQQIQSRFCQNAGISIIFLSIILKIILI